MKNSEGFKLTWKVYTLVFKFIKYLKRRWSVRKLLYKRFTTTTMRDNTVIKSPNVSTNGRADDAKSNKSTEWKKKVKETLHIPGPRSSTITPTPFSDSEDKRSIYNGNTTPFVHQSITRQLAFGVLDAEAGERKKKLLSEFYNSPWANLLAKFSTAAVIVVTIVLVIVFVTKKYS